MEKNVDSPQCVWVDTGDTSNFLYQYIEDPDQMGIFIETQTPFPVDTHLNVVIQDRRCDQLLTVHGHVSFVNVNTTLHTTPNPGMGIIVADTDNSVQNELTHLVKRVAYLSVEMSPQHSASH